MTISAAPKEPHARPNPTALRSLWSLGLVVVTLFLAAAYQWGGELKNRLEGKRAIGLVQERMNTNLIEGAANTDARSYDWVARKAAPDLYQVKQNIVLDRIWRFDRWENLCWRVRLSVEEVRRVDCQAIRWDRAPRKNRDH